MGDDSSIVQAARVSYGKGTKLKSDDRNLIRYLMRHDHTTPFEMAEIELHIKLPIFVARQWIRHRTASVNEYSARYSILDDEFYIPARERLTAQSVSNRQGGENEISDAEAASVLEILRSDAERSYSNYQWMLNEGARADHSRKGLTRELARINLTLSTYTQWYWKIDLHNLLRFIRLRADEHAQQEIRAYAQVLFKVVECWVPWATEAFSDYKLNSLTLSRRALWVVGKLIAGEKVDEKESGLSAREWGELKRSLNF